MALQKTLISVLKSLKIRTIYSWIIICSLLTGCSKTSEEPIEPKIVYSIPKNRLKQLPSSFSSLSEIERSEEWGKEYYIGQKLAQKLDLYRAVTAFKRAEILIPGYKKNRLQEIQYFILLSYYLGEKYQEAITAFEESLLSQVDSTFSTYRDLLIILHECFYRTKQPEKAKLVLKLIDESDHQLGQIMKVSYALTDFDKGDLNQLNFKTEIGQETKELIYQYELNKKSETKAQVFNALLPGAGYLYLGQKQAALTAFLLNGFTTYAAYYFFNQGNIAAGIITTSIETGWYFGGINGAKESAKLYNERLYENRAQPILQKHELFPVLNLSHSF